MTTHTNTNRLKGYYKFIIWTVLCICSASVASTASTATDHPCVFFMAYPPVRLLVSNVSAHTTHHLTFWPESYPNDRQ